MAAVILMGCIRTLRRIYTRFLRQIQMIQVLRLIYDSGGTHHLAVVVYENISHDSETQPLKLMFSLYFSSLSSTLRVVS